jgi:predicted enzyme involved in methoxymalonyl-ACP biosynthesis
LGKPFKNWFVKQMDAIQLKRKKCLILDLDNILWGGILGEDSIEGIKNDYLTIEKIVLGKTNI